MGVVEVMFGVFDLVCLVKVVFVKLRIFLRWIDEVILYLLFVCGVKLVFCSIKLFCGMRLGWVDNGCLFLGLFSKEVELFVVFIRLLSVCNGFVLVGNLCFFGLMLSVKFVSRFLFLEVNSVFKDLYCFFILMVLLNSICKW